METGLEVASIAAADVVNGIEIIGSDGDDRLVVAASVPLGVPISFIDTTAEDNDVLEFAGGGDRTWYITGEGAGYVDNVEFSGIENLTGAADNEDTFVFEDGGSLSAMLDGGDGGYDTLVLELSSINQLIYDAYGPDSGVITADGNAINFVGLEPITVAGTAGDLTVNVTSASPQDVTLLVDEGELKISGPGLESITTNPETVNSVTINLGTGNDSLTIGNVSGFSLNKLTVNGGTGTDTIKITRDADMTLTNTGLTVGGETITLDSIEQAELTGGASANTLDASTFTMGSVKLDGQGGNDILKGGTGNDTLIGGAGNDKFVFGDGWGSDTVIAGEGDGDILDFTGFTGTLSLSGTTFTSGANQVTQTDAAELIDVKLTTVEQTALVDTGLNALISMMENLEGYGQLANSLPLLSRLVDSSPIGAALGSIIGINETFTKLQESFSSYFSGSATDSFLGLVAALNGFSATVFGSDISNTLNPGNINLSTSNVTSRYQEGPGDVLELLIDFNLEGSQSSTFNLNLGAEAELLGIVIDTTIVLATSFDFDLTFGLEIGTSPKFFIDSATLELDASVTATGINASAKIGFLGASISGGSISMGGGLTVALNDPTPGDSRITTSDLGGSLSSLVSVSQGTTAHTASTFTSTLPLSVTAGGLDSTMQTALAGASIVLSYPTADPDGIFSGKMPSVVSVLSGTGVDLLDFSNITPNDVIGMLGQVMSAFTGLGQNDIFNLPVPFTDTTLGKILDYGTAFKRGVLDPLFVSGDAFKPDNDGDGAADFTFGSVQELANELASALGISVLAAFDTLDQELTFTFNWSEELSFGKAVVATTTQGVKDSTPEVQKVTIPATAVNFRLGFTDEEGNTNFTGLLTNDPNAEDAAAAKRLDDALEVLPGLNTSSNNVTVTRSGNVYTVTFNQSLGNVAQLVTGIPLNFGANIGDLAGIQTSGAIDAGVTIDTQMTFGIDLTGNSMIEITPTLYQPAESATPGVLSAAATFSLTLINRGAPQIVDGAYVYDSDGNVVRDPDTIIPPTPLSITVEPDVSNADINASIAWENLAKDVQAAIDLALHQAGLTLGFSSIALSGSTTVTAPHNSLLEAQNDIRFKVILNDGSTDQTGSGKLMQRQLIGNTLTANVADKFETAIADALKNINNSRATDDKISIDVGMSGGKLTFTATGLASGETLTIQPASMITATAGGGRIAISAPTVSAIPSDASDPQYTASTTVDRLVRVGITNAFDNTAFTEMGLASTPTQFNGKINHDASFTLVINGENVNVSLSKTATDDNTSIDDLVEDLQAAVNFALNLLTNPFTEGDIEVYRLDPSGNRIGLRTADAPSVTISTLAISVAGTAADNGAISDLGFESGEGATKRSVATEFFLQNVSLTGTATLNVPNASMAANIGFLGIEASGSGSISAEASLALKNPLVASGNALEDRIDFMVLANALLDGKYLYDPTETGGTVEDPDTGVLDASLSGDLVFHLDIAPTGALSGIAGADADADLSMTVADWLSAPPSADDLEFSFTGPDWDTVFASFQDLSFDNILGALQELLQMLRTIDGSGGGSAIAGVLDYKLPLVDRSLTEILDFAGEWADRLEALMANPAGSLQQLEILLRDVFDIPDSAPDILSFIPYDTSSPNTTGVLDFDFDLGIGTQLNRPFSLDLANVADLPSWLTSLMGVSASGNLDIAADINLALRMGLDLFGEDKAFFLYTGDDGTKLTANASASGNDLDFTAQIGPFAIFVIGGTAQLAAGVEVGLANFMGLRPCHHTAAAATGST
jgi:hypothetical protein